MTYRPSAIVLGYDGGSTTGQALTVAVDLTSRMEGHLYIVHVVTLRDYPVSPDTANWEADASHHLRQEESMLREQLAPARIAWTYRVEPGDPVDALDRVARQVTGLMIVIGSQGYGWAARFASLAGAAPSISGGLRRASTPVLIVQSIRTPSPDGPPRDAPQPLDEPN